VGGGGGGGGGWGGGGGGGGGGGVGGGGGGGGGDSTRLRYLCTRLLDPGMQFQIDAWDASRHEMNCACKVGSRREESD